MLPRLSELLARRRYELLLFGLVQHLFSPVFLPDVDVYRVWVWPVNMVVLGVTSIGVFSGVTGARRIARDVLAVVVVAFPAVPLFVTVTPTWLVALSISYGLFFVVIFVEVLRYMLRPSYVNVDLVSAGLCGYLLLLETGAFATQAIHYALPDAYHGISTTSPAHAYLDIVYFCSITLTSIGFGDITPAHHVSRLATALLGIVGQLYSVVLMGILVGKYTSASTGPST